jgi:hypothetical protein
MCQSGRFSSRAERCRAFPRKEGGVPLRGAIALSGAVRSAGENNGRESMEEPNPPTSLSLCLVGSLAAHGLARSAMNVNRPPSLADLNAGRSGVR